MQAVFDRLTQICRGHYISDSTQTSKSDESRCSSSGATTRPHLASRMLETEREIEQDLSDHFGGCPKWSGRRRSSTGGGP